MLSYGDLFFESPDELAWLFYSCIDLLKRFSPVIEEGDT
jgi:hypothetical protein